MTDQNSKLESAYKAVHNVGFTSDSKATMDAAWNESDHPRAENGEFGSGGGSGSKSASELSREMTELRKSAPRPIAKLYGSNGPTPEQAEKHKQQTSEYNSKMRKLSKEQKIALERDNAAYRAAHSQ